MEGLSDGADIAGTQALFRFLPVGSRVLELALCTTEEE